MCGDACMHTWSRQTCSGIAGFALAFFRGLAASERPEQRTTFCRSMADGWDTAHRQPTPTFKERLTSLREIFGRKATFSAASEELTCILCLCLTAFGPGAILEVNYCSPRFCIHLTELSMLNTSLLQCWHQAMLEARDATLQACIADIHA